MTCTTGRRTATAELETTDGSTASPAPPTAPLQRIEHGLEAAFGQLEEVSLALTEITSELRMVPLEQVAFAGRVGVLMSDLRMLKLSLGTLVLREPVPSMG